MDKSLRERLIVASHTTNVDVTAVPRLVEDRYGECIAIGQFRITDWLAWAAANNCNVHITLEVVPPADVPVGHPGSERNPNVDPFAPRKGVLCVSPQPH